MKVKNAMRNVKQPAQHQSMTMEKSWVMTGHQTDKERLTNMIETVVWTHSCSSLSLRTC